MEFQQIVMLICGFSGILIVPATLAAIGFLSYRSRKQSGVS